MALPGAERGAPSRTRRAAALAAVAAAVAATALLGGLVTVAPAGAARTVSDARVTRAATTAVPTTVATPSFATGSAAADGPGRIAYVTPSGDVMVASSDGSRAKLVGTGAVSNAAGLAPLAWSPAGDHVAYVRRDRALVLADPSGGAPKIVATDAVVPPGADEQLLSFDFLGQSVTYIQEVAPGKDRAAVAVFGGQTAGTTIGLSDPATRIPLSIQWSPLDPYLFLRSADVETGKEFTLAIVTPFGASPTPFPTPITIDDPVFAPDGAYAYGITRGPGKDQLVRIDVTTAAVDLLVDLDHICRPQPSPDGTRIVFASGPNCGETWVMGTDGSNPHRIAEPPGAASDFSLGSYSWSLDGAVISHPACSLAGATVTCGTGPYVDVRSDGTRRILKIAARSVRREYRPLIKPLKLEIDMTGPISYSKKVLLNVGADGTTGGLLDQLGGSTIDAKAVDERDAHRMFDITGVVPTGTRWLVGSLHIVDPAGHVDHQVTLLGTMVVLSYRRATMRAIWMSTDGFPFQAGRVDLVIYR